MAEQATARSRAGWWRLLLLVTVLIGALVAHTVGLTSELTDPAAIRDLLTQSGPLGPVVFIVAFALTHTVGFPSMVLVVVAAAVWPLGSAILIAWAGGVVGTSFAYGIAAWAGRDWAMQRIPPRLRRLDRRITESGVLALLGVRLLLLTPAPADWVCGVSSMRYRDFLATTMVGLIPPMIVISTVVSDRVPIGAVASVTVGASLLLAAGAWLAARRSATVRHRLRLLVAPKRAGTEKDPSRS